MRDMTNTTGLRQSTVLRWVRRFRDNGETSNPVHKGPGRGKIVTHPTMNFIKSQIECDPRLTAEELKEQNPCVLGAVSKDCTHNLEQQTGTAAAKQDQNHFLPK